MKNKEYAAINGYTLHIHTCTYTLTEWDGSYSTTYLHYFCAIFFKDIKQQNANSEVLSSIVACVVQAYSGIIATRDTHYVYVHKFPSF